jgi:hypothetical protein
VSPQVDVQITWWARVPASPTGGEYNYLRMSLYGVEGGSSYAGDTALLGYACRSATVGTPTSLTYYNGGWLLSGVNFTPNAWEEYRMTTYTSESTYTIVKNPSSADPVVIVNRKPMIGTGTSVFMAAWSSSNLTNHPPVYIDDIEIKSVANPDKLPVAGADTVTRPNQLGVKVSTATLLSNDSDPDNDTLNIIGVDSLSTQGGTVSLSGGWVFYTPPAGNPATDTFTYKLSDGRDIWIPGTVTVNRAGADTGQPHTITGIATNVDGTVTITFAGIPGQVYVVEATPDMVTPTWVPIATNPAGPNGLFQYTDMDAPSYPSRFYRTAIP